MPSPVPLVPPVPPAPTLVSTLQHPSPQAILSLGSDWVALRVVLGGLFVKGYRVLKVFEDVGCLLLTKKEMIHSKYTFLKFCEDYDKDKIDLSSIERCKYKLDKMCGRKVQNYSFLLLFTKSFTTLYLTPCPSMVQLLKYTVTKSTLVEKIPSNHLIEYVFNIPYFYIEDTFIKQDTIYQKNLFEIVYSYIDTFGQKTKQNFYKYLSPKSTYLLNTINAVLFDHLLSIPQLFYQYQYEEEEDDEEEEGVKGNGGYLKKCYTVEIDDDSDQDCVCVHVDLESKPNKKPLKQKKKVKRQFIQPLVHTYTQIYSSHWTKFSHNKTSFDRMDIVLSGGGNVLVLDLVIGEDLDLFISYEYEYYVMVMMSYYQHAYKNGQCKVINISNVLSYNHIYDYYGRIVAPFP